MSVSDTVTTLGATTEFKLLPNISSLVARELDLKLGGLVVARMTVVRPWAVVFIIITATVTHSIQHGLHTLTAVHMSTLGLDQYWYRVLTDTRKYQLVSVATDTRFSIAANTSSHVVHWLIGRP